MISLNPPYQAIDGYTVLSDHADPTLFYVLPSAPRLGHTANGDPALTLVQYLGGGLGAQTLAGGLLTLTTELVVPEEVLPTLKGRIRAKTGGMASGDIRLLPVLFDEGGVELIALGQRSSPAEETSRSETGTPLSPPPAPPASGELKVQILGSGKPSLSGTNSTSFQLLLDATAAELIERALDTPDLPIIAIYRMTFAGLRPSFQIDIQADWQKVYHSLRNKANVNVYFVAADAEALITYALEENHIKIDPTVFGTSDDARAAAERAQKYLVDWVLQHLFTPLVDPNSAMANAIGHAIDDTVWSLARTLLPGVGYRLNILEDTQVRTLSARMNEAVAERLEVVPQGTLGGLLQRYRFDVRGQPNPRWPAIRSSLVQKVNLSGFPRMEISIGVEDRFASDGLTEVIVDIGRVLADGNLADIQSFTLRSAAERKNYIVNLLGQPDFSTLYRYRSQIHFDPAGLFGAHAPIVSSWQAGNTNELFVEPRDLYTIRDVQVNVSPTFPFTQFPAVSVELLYAAEGEATSQRGLVQLTQKEPSQAWRFRSFGTAEQPYEYRVTYHRSPENGGDIELPARQQIDKWLSIPDPLPTKRTLDLFVALPWSDIAVAFIHIRYNDEAHGIHYEERIDLNSTIHYLRRDFPIAANGSRVLAYRLTALLNTGALLEGSWRETRDERLVIDTHLVETKLVTVRAVGGNLKENRLAEVHVKLQVRVPGTQQVRDSTELVLSGDIQNAPPPSWEYLLGDPPVHTVFYSALFIDSDGFPSRTPWQSTEADLLVVQLRNKTISG